LVTGYTLPHAILNHLGVPSLAMAGNPKNLAGDGNVMDVLVLEVRVLSVRMLRVESLAEAFRELCSALFRYGDAMDGPLSSHGVR
jgi:hypothetical protein